jgi:hypothetical protein
MGLNGANLQAPHAGVRQISSAMFGPKACATAHVVPPSSDS